MLFQRCRIELRTEHIADRVALECAADAAAEPVYVLQASVAVVRRRNAEVVLHPGIPRVGQILHAQLAF